MITTEHHKITFHLPDGSTESWESEPIPDAMCERLIASFAKDAETPGCPTPQEQINRARRALKAAFEIP